MNLFAFLEKLSQEGFVFQLHYAGPPSTIEVHVDAYYERWLVSFDEKGFVDFTKYAEAETGIEERDRLNDLFDRSGRAWDEAAKDLGIRFIRPYRFEALGEEHIATGLLPDFGSERGTLLHRVRIQRKRPRRPDKMRVAETSAWARRLEPARSGPGACLSPTVV